MRALGHFLMECDLTAGNGAAAAAAAAAAAGGNGAAAAATATAAARRGGNGIPNPMLALIIAGDQHAPLAKPKIGPYGALS